MIYKEHAFLLTKRYCRSARYLVLPFTIFYYLLLSRTTLSSLGDYLWKRKNYMF